MHVIQRDKSNVKHFIRIAAPIINQEICKGVVSLHRTCRAGLRKFACSKSLKTMLIAVTEKEDEPKRMHAISAEPSLVASLHFKI